MSIMSIFTLLYSGKKIIYIEIYIERIGTYQIRLSDMGWILFGIRQTPTIFAAL